MQHEPGTPGADAKNEEKIDDAINNLEDIDENKENLPTDEQSENEVQIIGNITVTDDMEGRVGKTGEEKQESNSLTDDPMNVDSEYQTAAFTQVSQVDNATETQSESVEADTSTKSQQKSVSNNDKTNRNTHSSNEPNDDEINTLDTPTTPKQPKSNNVLYIISFSLVIIACILYQFLFSERKASINLQCPNIDSPVIIQLPSQNTQLSASHPSHTKGTEYKWNVQNTNECSYVMNGQETTQLAIMGFGKCKPFDLELRLFISAVEKAFMRSNIPHAVICDITLKFVYPPTETYPDSPLFHCPSVESHILLTKSVTTEITAFQTGHPSNTVYEWTVQPSNVNECNLNAIGEDTSQLTLTGFNKCAPFTLAVKLLMSATIDGYKRHSKACNINLRYVYPPIETRPDSDIFHCPIVQTEQVLVTSASKKISALHSEHPSNANYQWVIAKTNDKCEFGITDPNENTVSISAFSDCEPFDLQMVLKMDAIIDGYFNHSKSCPVHLKFVYPPPQLITDSDLFSCPNIDNPYYVSLSTLNETISVPNGNNPSNTIYEWSVQPNDNDCKHDIVGRKTDSLSILGVGKTNCDPFKLNVMLVMNASVNPYTTHTKTCQIDVIFHDNPVFGIDLGTTYSCISYQKNIKNEYYRRRTQFVVVDTKRNKYCVPSAVYFTRDEHGNKHTVIGQDAVNKVKDDPQNVLYDIKRIIGRSPNDKNFKSFKENHLFKILDDNKHVYIPNWNESLLFEQVLSILLTHLAELASKKWYYDREGNNPFRYVQDVVVSAPALFHNGQRKGIRSACHLAGLHPRKLVIEPSAAAVAHSYYLKEPDRRTSRFLAFDFGGGTLDTSVMRCAGLECTVLSVHGNSGLGGIDFDTVIRDIIVRKFKEEHGWTDISEKLYSKIFQISEQIKIELTESTDYQLSLANDEGSVKQITITRDEFEQHSTTQALLQSAIDAANHAIGLTESHSAKNIKMILLIGGTSKIPIVQSYLKKEFGEILVLSDRTDAQLMVGEGCGVIGGAVAYQKYASSHLDVVLTDLLPLSIGYQECVLDNGALDCKRMKKIIRKNTQYPTKETDVTCQKRPDGNKLRLKLYEGDNKHVDDNYFLGEITINDIQTREASVCDNVLLAFIVDKNGIVHCEAETNPKYGEVKRYNLTIASENSKHGTVAKENVIQLTQAMKAWYNKKSFNLINKLLNDDPELNTLFDDTDEDAV